MASDQCPKCRSTVRYIMLPECDNTGGWDMWHRGQPVSYRAFSPAYLAQIRGPVVASGDGVQHDLETHCAKCGQHYSLHRGDEVECVCPARPAVAGVREAARALVATERGDRNLATRIDSQGRFLAVFLGPGGLDYAKVWEWAKRERGALVPHDLVGILQKDRRFRRLGQYRVVDADALAALRAALSRPVPAADAEAVREAAGAVLRDADAHVVTRDSAGVAIQHSVQNRLVEALRAALSRPAADASGAEAMRDDICKGCSTYEWCSVTGACLADSDPHDEGDWRRVVSTLTALAPLPPASAGGEVEAARLLPTTLDGVTLIRGDTLQRTIIASPDIYEAFRAAFSAERAAAKGGA